MKQTTIIACWMVAWAFLFSVIWAIIGSLIQDYELIVHPAYWSLYGAIWGISLDRILNLAKTFFKISAQS